MTKLRETWNCPAPLKLSNVVIRNNDNIPVQSVGYNR